MSLTPKQKAALKARAHDLKPIVHLGKKGLTSEVLEEISHGLLAHELIKIRLLETLDLEETTLVEELENQLLCDVVEIRGNTLVIYKKRPKKKRV